MFVACGAQSGVNSNGNTESQNAEVDLPKKVERANTDEALLAKYGKVAYRNVYTYSDGHSESTYLYLDADRYVMEGESYIDIVEDGDQTLYLDAECTTVYEGGADLNSDLTLYYK